MKATGGLDDLVSPREAARRLGVHENTVRNWISRGVVEAVTLPNSRHKRLRVVDVDRLADDLRRQDVATLRASISPELVDASHLEAWAHSRDASSMLPEVVGRLIGGTAGVAGLSMRAGEGVLLSGWDGLVEDSSGSPWVPIGPSAWELGTAADPERKADEDYAKRTTAPVGVVASVTTFVFVTPRRWPRARKWELERRAEGVWRSIRVIDGDDLAAWLASQPDTHLWFSERLGLRPLDVQTATSWWIDFCGPILPPEVMLSGRDESVQQIRTAALSSRPSATFVRANSREEATAFIAASLHALPSLKAAPLVTVTRATWDRLSLTSTSLVLIPFVDNPSIGVAVAQGHRVFVPVGADTSPIRGDVIEIAPLDRTIAREVFAAKLHVSFEEADRLAALTRRSFAALLRDPVLAPGARSSPGWSQGAAARMYARLALVGAWTFAKEDLECVAAIADQPWQAIEDQLIASSRLGDPPFIRTSDGWQVASPDGAWSLLHDSLEAADIRRFCDQTVLILTEVDPSLELSAEDRILAGVRGERPRFSATLRSGVAQGLALLGVFDYKVADSSAGSDYAASGVRDLLHRANQDSTTRIWRSLSRQLQLLAEAAPNQFLSAIDTGLAGALPSLSSMFADSDRASSLSASSPHTGLLWALELLCWSADHLSAAAMALARLAEIDPGGQLGNRPAGSLRAVFLAWRPRTRASVGERLEVLDLLRHAYPDVAWNLELALLPSSPDTTLNTPVPRFRRWQTTEQPISVAEWLDAISGILDRAIEDAGTAGARWGQLIGHIGSLPPNQSDLLLTKLEALVGKLSPRPDQMELWHALADLIGHHREFPTANWVLPEVPLARLEAVAGELRPQDLVERYAHLFAWHPHLPDVDRSNFAKYDQALDRARYDAVQDIHQREGVEGVERLARSSKLTEAVGIYLAATRADEYESRVLDRLGGDDLGRRFAAGWIQRRVADDSGWMERVGQVLLSLSAEIQVAFVFALGVPNTSVLALLETLPSFVQDRYWQEVVPANVDNGALVAVVEQLLSYRRPWTAIDLLALALHRERTASPPVVETTLVLSVFGMALVGGAEDHLSGRAAYEVGQLLDYLERKGTDQTTLSSLEWSFFSLTEHTRPPRALFLALESEPERFVDMVCAVYREKHRTEPRELDERAKAYARHAWAVLRKWRTPPGLEADGHWNAERLRLWARRARHLLADRDRIDIGDQQIGQMLSGSPKGSDGVWPAEVVRELIEDIGSQQLELGFVIGIEGGRGVTVRGPYDGGDQERKLAAQYRDWSTAIINVWPRTGMALRIVAEHYEREARREDAAARDSAME